MSLKELDINFQHYLQHVSCHTVTKFPVNTVDMTSVPSVGTTVLGPCQGRV